MCDEAPRIEHDGIELRYAACSRKVNLARKPLLLLRSFILGGITDICSAVACDVSISCF